MNRKNLALMFLALCAPYSFLSADVISHARKQVEHMLADRPGMVVFRESDSRKGAYIDESSEIYKHAMDVFAGKYAGERVFWGADPPKGAMATHHGVAMFGINMISVANQSGDKANAFEDMWSCFFYEAFNMSHVDGWKDVVAKAKSKIATPEEYVKECARLEWSVYPELRKFYTDEWLAWATKAKFDSDSKIWFPFEKKDEDNFEFWYALWKDKTSYPWVPYLQQYEVFSWSEKKHGQSQPDIDDETED